MSDNNRKRDGAHPPDTLLSKGLCEGVRFDGNPCGAPPSQTGLCFWHDPERREDRLEAARKGGSRKALELPVGQALTPGEARGLLAAVVAALLQGAVDPGTARTVAYILQVDAKIAEGEAMERRVSAIEEMMDRRGGTNR